MSNFLKDRAEFDEQNEIDRVNIEQNNRRSVQQRFFDNLDVIQKNTGCYFCTIIDMQIGDAGICIYNEKNAGEIYKHFKTEKEFDEWLLIAVTEQK